MQNFLKLNVYDQVELNYDANLYKNEHSQPSALS